MARNLQSRGPGYVDIQKVKAHATETDLAMGLTTLLLFYGNSMADEAAKWAAKHVRLSATVRDNVSLRLGVINKIWNRIVRAHRCTLELGGPPPSALPRRRRARNIHLLIQQQTGHRLEKYCKAWRCKNCHCTVLKRGLHAWLRAHPCEARAQHSSFLNFHAMGYKLVGLSSEIQLGTKMIHATHKVASARGLWFCLHCGFFASSGVNSKVSPKGLTSECPPAPTKHGKEYLKRLGKGLPPKANMSWPSTC